MTDVETVDARGLSCPQPALMTRRTLGGLTTGTVEVLVDNPTSRDNVARMAEKAGWNVTVEERAEGCFRLALTK